MPFQIKDQYFKQAELNERFKIKSYLDPKGKKAENYKYKYKKHSGNVSSKERQDKIKSK